MNIWYVHPYLGVPENAEYGRGFFLGKAMSEKGVKLRAITSSYHHLIKSDYEQDTLIHNSEISSVPFTWIKTPKYIGNGLKRIINMIAFGYRFRFIDLVDQHEIEKPDVIVLSSAHPFHLIGGLYWAKKYKSKLIFEVRDIWPLSLHQLLGLSPLHPFSLLLSWFEKKAYKSVDWVVSLLPNAEAHMKSRGMKSGMFSYIPNGIHVDTNIGNTRSTYRDYIAKIQSKGAFIVMYTGALGVPNAMESLLEAAKVLQDNGNTKIQFVIIGDGVRKVNLVEASKNHRLENFHILEPIPRNEILDTLDLSNLVFIGGRNIPLYEFGVSPNKMFEYMLASKPILMTVSSPNNPLELAKAGSCIGTNDPYAIADEIIRYSALPTEKLIEIGKRGREYVREHHFYDVLAQQYLGVIDTIR